LENGGYQFEAAEGSLELLLRRQNGEAVDHFALKGFRVLIEKNADGTSRSEATIRLVVNGREEHTAAEGNGPVHALDNAVRKALMRFFPEVARMQLSDYKVRVLNEKDATAARVRVLIESRDEHRAWSTIGVSENIIEASWQALSDSFAYFLMKRADPQPVAQTADETVERSV